MPGSEDRRLSQAQKNWVEERPKGRRQKGTIDIRGSLKGINGQMVQDLVGPCTEPISMLA